MCFLVAFLSVSCAGLFLGKAGVPVWRRSTDLETARGSSTCASASHGVACGKLGSDAQIVAMDQDKALTVDSADISVLPENFSVPENNLRSLIVDA